MNEPQLPPLPECDSYCTHKDTHEYDVFTAEQMKEYALLTAVQYRNGNTALLEALMDMVHQHFADTPDGFLQHGFISSDENAIDVLLRAQMAEHVSGKGYRLLWEELEARKPKQKTWAEVVNECIDDPARRAELLSTDGPARALPQGAPDA
jgi:hypothetical protein